MLLSWHRFYNFFFVADCEIPIYIRVNELTRQRQHTTRINIMLQCWYTTDMTEEKITAAFKPTHKHCENVKHFYFHKKDHCGLCTCIVCVLNCWYIVLQLFEEYSNHNLFKLRPWTNHWAYLKWLWIGQNCSTINIHCS